MGTLSVTAGLLSALLLTNFLEWQVVLTALQRHTDPPIISSHLNIAGKGVMLAFTLFHQLK